MERWAGTVEEADVSFWPDRTVFVTGATGLLGSWLVEALLDRGAHETLPYTEETPLSVREAATSVLEAVGRPDLRLAVLNEATHKIPRQFLDCSMAHRVLGWKPGHTLEQGLADTADWYRRHLLG